VILKIAKIEGRLAPDTNVNVFGSLSAKEFADRWRSLEKPASPTLPAPYDN
jgi:hypothetical protein